MRKWPRAAVCPGALQIPLFKEEIKEGEEVRQVGKEREVVGKATECLQSPQGRSGEASYSHTPKAAWNKEPLCRTLCVNHGGAKRREGRPFRTALRQEYACGGGAGGMVKN